jgi:hypothetical protein
VWLDFAFAHGLVFQAFEQVKADDLACLLCPQKQHVRNFEVAHDMSPKTIILMTNEI